LSFKNGSDGLDGHKKMRLWSIHPRYLDAKGLVALWREGLLAQAVLNGKTKGYQNHPQLIRFKRNDPLAAIGSYLNVVQLEAVKRGYNFDRTKIICKSPFRRKISVTDAQIEYEFLHLKRKLKIRDRKQYRLVVSVEKPDIHPLFKEISGSIESWEVVR
jgi:hypothetical protein